MRTGFYWRWVAACAVGEVLGIGAAAAAALLSAAWIGEPQTTAARMGLLAVFVIVAFVEGGALSVLQWRVLRERLPRLRAGEWMAPTVAVAIAGWLAGMTPSIFLSEAPGPSAEPGLGMVLALAAIVGAGAGLLFGAAQWVVLRRHAERASRWIWIHIPAWGLAMAVIFLGASLPSQDSPAWAIAASGAAGGLLGGVLLGAVSGLVARRLAPWVDEQAWSLCGKVCIVTGANSGIGREVAMGLARLGGTVGLLCRRPSEGERIRQAILSAQPGASLAVILCDLADFGAIRAAAARILTEWPRVDILVHNAGATFPERTVTKEGVEATLAVDVVGPFLLTALLRERLETAGARVITMTGIYHRRGRIDRTDLHFERRPYGWLAANNQAQRGRWLFTSELARRSPRLTAASVHPGAVITAAQAKLPRFARILLRTLARPGFVRAEVGAIPALRLAAHPDASQWTGRFFNRCALAPDAADRELARHFWEACEKLTGEPWPEASQPVNTGGG